MSDRGTEISVTREADICNKRGLHARASAKFVTLAAQYDAQIKVSHGGSTVGGTSIMGLMMLAASIGETISITATGPQAQDALDALCDLIARKFDEAV
jgi:phosphocarrier protein